MKRYILVAALYLFMAVLMAETGLFDLNFGQDLAEAHEALLAKGFLETQRDDTSVTYKNAQIPGLIDLEIWDSNDVDTISGWTVHYDIKDNAGLVQKMLADLKAIHENEPVKSDSIFEEWFWDLGYSYEMGMSLSEDKSMLTIDYVDANDGWHWGG